MDYDFSLKRGKKRFRCEDDENESGDDSDSKKKESKSKKEKFGTKKLGEDKSISITSVNNHIYFYCSVSKSSALSLNKEIRTVTRDLLTYSRKYGMNPPPIYLHINSYGGSVFAGLSIIDQIKENAIPIYSIIEGAAASAATMISVCCDKRFIKPNSYMLIHQLSSGFWGKMNEFEDEMTNLKELMKVIKKIYIEHTKLKGDALDDILKHDLWWNASICKKKGLVDKIWAGAEKKKLKVNEASN